MPSGQIFDNMRENLKKRTLNALVWSFIDKCGQQLLYFASGIVLANLLTPEDFGKVGVLTLFITLSGILTDSGFGSALIRKKEATEADYSTVFYFNLLVGVVLYGILFFTAPVIARFLEIPELTLIARLLFLSIVFQGFGLIQQVRLTKHIAFSRLARINIIAILGGSLLAILHALYYRNVWALVVLQLSIAAIRTLLLWLFGRWRPRPIFRKSALDEFFAYSSRLIGTGILNAIYNNIYPLLIGKGYSTVTVGYYMQAHKFQEAPSSLISLIFRSVAFPVLSAIHDEHERMIRIFRKYIHAVAFFIFPVMTLCIVVAEPLVRILLSDKWIESIPYLQRLCVAGAFSPFIILYYDLFNTIGRSDINLKTELVKKLLLTGGIILCFGHGVFALIWLWVGYTLASLAASTLLGQRFTGYRVGQFAADIVPCLLLALVAGGIAWASYALCHTLLSKLLIPTAIYIFVYLLAARVAKIEMWKEIRILFTRESTPPTSEK